MNKIIFVAVGFFSYSLAFGMDSEIALGSILGAYNQVPAGEKETIKKMAIEAYYALDDATRANPMVKVKFSAIGVKPVDLPTNRPAVASTSGVAAKAASAEFQQAMDRNPKTAILELFRNQKNSGYKSVKAVAFKDDGKTPDPVGQKALEDTRETIRAIQEGRA